MTDVYLTMDDVITALQPLYNAADQARIEAGSISAMVGCILGVMLVILLLGRW